MVYRNSVRAFILLALLGAGVSAHAAPEEMPRAEDGARALVRGEAREAAARYTEALAETGLSNDRRAAILNDRGVAYIKLGDTRRAFEDFNLAIELFPEFAAVYNNRGNLLLSLGLSKEAVKDFDRAIVLAPGYAAAYNNRAGAYVRLGEMDEAIADYTQAVRLLPQNPAPLSGRGLAHLAQLRPHAAIRDFTRAVAADSRFATAYRNRAEAKLEVEHFEEAIEDLSRAIAFDPNVAETYVLRGKAYLATHNAVSAIKDFSKAIELDPENAKAFAERGLAHGMAEAFEEAMGDLNRAIEIDPRSSLAFAYRAYVYQQNGHPDIASRDIDVAAKLDADTPEVHWVKAEIADSQGQVTDAIRHIEKALALRPGYRKAHETLQRMGGASLLAEDAVVSGAGVDDWRVVKRGPRFFALNDQYPGLSVPLEMMGGGTPRLIRWDLKEAPFRGIGVLHFHGGRVVGRGKKADEIEQAAIVDVERGLVIAIEPHRQGERVATWTWDDGRVTVASVDGVTDTFTLRATRPAVAAPAGRRYRGSEGSDWAPWNTPFGAFSGGPSSPPKRATVKKKKQKSIFDLLFN